MAIGEVNVSVDRKEGVESSLVVSREEESSENTVAVRRICYSSRCERK